VCAWFVSVSLTRDSNAETDAQWGPNPATSDANLWTGCAQEASRGRRVSLLLQVEGNAVPARDARFCSAQTFVGTGTNHADPQHDRMEAGRIPGRLTRHAGPAACGGALGRPLVLFGLHCRGGAATRGGPGGVAHRARRRTRPRRGHRARPPVRRRRQSTGWRTVAGPCA
jgi:hypothetical protein